MLPPRDIKEKLGLAFYGFEKLKDGSAELLLPWMDFLLLSLWRIENVHTCNHLVIVRLIEWPLNQDSNC